MEAVRAVLALIFATQTGEKLVTKFTLCSILKCSDDVQSFTSFICAPLRDRFETCQFLNVTTLKLVDLIKIFQQTVKKCGTRGI